VAIFESSQQRDRDRMRRAAQADRVLAARHPGGDARGALKDQRQRAGPEGVDQLPRLYRNRIGPVSQVGAGRQVHDHRMIMRAALGPIDAGYGRRILGIRAQAIHGFGGESDQAAGCKQRGGPRYVIGAGAKQRGCRSGHRSARQQAQRFRVFA
jgi:hypothetical protein